MSELSTIEKQLQGLEAEPPIYDYEGLSLPEGLLVDASFGSHTYLGEAEDIQRELLSHDVVVHENFGQSEHTGKIFNRIARGDYSALQRILADAQLSSNSLPTESNILSIKAVYNIRRPLLTVDPPAGHRIVRDINKYHQGEPYFGPDFEKAVQSRKKTLQGHSQVNLDRENFMLRRFCEQVSELADSDPKMSKVARTAGGLSVIMFDFGLTHAGLYNGLREVARRSGFELGGDVVIRNDSDCFLHYEAQAKGRHLHGIEIDDLLAAKDIVSRIITRKIMKRPENPLPEMEAWVVSTNEIDGLDLEQLGAMYPSL